MITFNNPLITKEVLWGEFVKPTCGGFNMTIPHECHMAAAAEAEIELKNVDKNTFIKKLDKEEDFQWINDIYQLSFGILLNLRSTPLEVPVKKGSSKTYKVVTTFTLEEIFQNNKLSSENKEALYEECEKKHRFAFFLSEKNTNKIIYVGLNGALDLFQKKSQTKKLAAIGLARFNENGRFTQEDEISYLGRESEKRSDEKKTTANIPTGFRVEHLKNANLLALTDDQHQKWLKRLSGAFQELKNSSDNPDKKVVENQNYNDK